MLNITYHPDRLIEEGQYYIELITFNHADFSTTERFGYFCDLGHIKHGVFPSLVGYAPILLEQLSEALKERLKETHDRK